MSRCPDDVDVGLWRRDGVVERVPGDAARAERRFDLDVDRGTRTPRSTMPLPARPRLEASSGTWAYLQAWSGPVAPFRTFRGLSPQLPHAAQALLLHRALRDGRRWKSLPLGLN